MHLRTLIVASATLVAVLLALVTSSAPHAAGGGLVAAYAFDEGAGITVRDSSSQGNAGTTLNTTWSASGRFGGALAFNGSSSWVTVPDSASLDLTKSFTIEAWVKPAADMGATWQTIAFKEGLGDLVYGLYASSDTSTPAAVANVPDGKADLRALAPLPANVWTHVATTFDGSTLRVYVNGTQVSTRTVSGALPVSTGALHIGGNNIRGEWFRGELDDLRVYGQSLSASKISNDMTTAVTPPAGPPPPPPLDITPPSTPTAVFTSTSLSSSSSIGSRMRSLR